MKKNQPLSSYLRILFSSQQRMMQFSGPILGSFPLILLLCLEPSATNYERPRKMARLANQLFGGPQGVCVCVSVAGECVICSDTSLLLKFEWLRADGTNARLRPQARPISASRTAHPNSNSGQPFMWWATCLLTLADLACFGLVFQNSNPSAVATETSSAQKSHSFIDSSP